jgi:mannosyltransferase OCH1-like enzyme
MKNPVFYRDLYYHCLRSKFSPARDSVEAQDAIPKVIHYCWFGKNPETELMRKCMESWAEFCPDYTLHLWNEDNFPFEKYPFARQAFEDRKWAYVSDVARLHALYYHGGIYMDTDVQVLKPLDRFLSEEVFSGYEAPGRIPTGIMAGRAGHEYLWLLLLWYVNRHYGKSYYGIPNVRIITKLTKLLYGANIESQELILKGGVHFYPEEYFCPKDARTDNSYCVHHFAGSWTTP